MTGLPSANGLRHRITIQNRSVVDDTFGQDQQIWTDVASCYAQIEPFSGSSQIAGEAQQSSVSHTIFIRFRRGITARMRAVFGARIFEIEAVMNIDERSAWLQLDCTEGLTAG